MLGTSEFLHCTWDCKVFIRDGIVFLLMIIKIYMHHFVVAILFCVECKTWFEINAAYTLRLTIDLHHLAMSLLYYLVSCYPLFVSHTLTVLSINKPCMILPYRIEALSATSKQRTFTIKFQFFYQIVAASFSVVTLTFMVYWTDGSYYIGKKDIEEKNHILL